MDFDSAPPRRTFSILFVGVGILVASAVVILPIMNNSDRGSGLNDPSSAHSAVDSDRTQPGSTRDVLVFEADADGSVFGATPDRVLSHDADLRIDADPRIESMIAFTVSDLDAPVAAASIRLYTLSEVGSPIRAHPTNPEWDELLLSYRNRPSRISPEFREGTTGPTNAWVEVDVTPFINGDGRFSFTLDQESRTLIRLSAREGDHPPQLVVTLAHPESSPPVAHQSEVHLSSDNVLWVPRIENPAERPLTCTLVRSPSRGSVSVAPDCTSITYTARPGSAGTDRFDYVVADGTYKVGVPTNIVFDTPVGMPVTSAATVFSELGVATRVQLRGFDPDGRCPVTFVVKANDAGGAVGPVEDLECWKGFATGTVTVSPPPDPTRGATFQFAAVDVDSLRSGFSDVVVRDSATAPVVTVLPTFDGAVSQEMDNSSILGATMRVDAEPASVAYLLFDVGNIPLQPTSVSLRLHFSSSSFEGIAVHAGSSEWTEQGLMLGDQPDFTGSPLVRTGPVWDGEWIDVPIPTYLLAGGVVSLALTTSGSRAVSVGSVEGPFPPALLITQAVPGTLGTYEGVGR